MSFESKVIPSFHNDPFNAVLFESDLSKVTDEQMNMIDRVLQLSSSDARFAQKAYIAIKLILNGGTQVLIPFISSLNPSSAVINSAPFELMIEGEDFDASCVIYINGNEMTTEFISKTELSAMIDLSGVNDPASYNVVVINSYNIVSNPMIFTVTDVIETVKSTPVKSYTKESHPSVPSIPSVPSAKSSGKK